MGDLGQAAGFVAEGEVGSEHGFGLQLMLLKIRHGVEEKESLIGNSYINKNLLSDKKN